VSSDIWGRRQPPRISHSQEGHSNILKKNEKLDNGISNSSIPFFGTTSSALQIGSEKPLGGKKEKRRLIKKPVSDYSRYNLLKNPTEIMG
jgi:hypothetical protein